MRTLAPLVEAASLEHDEPMVDRWASLLANAAGGQQNVPPSFPLVLRELEPDAARLLDSVYDEHMRYTPELRREIFVVVGDDIPEPLNPTQGTLEFHVDNLVRLRLVHSPQERTGLPDDSFKLLALTEFGRAFVKACRPPGQPDPPVEWTDREALMRHIDEREQAARLAAAERASADAQAD